MSCERRMSVWWMESSDDRTSPARCLFGCCTKTLLPTAGRLLTQPEFDTTSQLLHAQKNKQAFYYNNGTKELRPLEPGSTVRIHPPKYSHQWTQATVDKQVGVRSYQVTSDDGRVYRRNRRHLRLTAEVPKQSPPDIEVSSSDPGPLPLTKAEQVPPVAESMPQEVVKPQAAPGPPPDDISSPERCSTWGRLLRRPAYFNDYACWHFSYVIYVLRTITIGNNSPFFFFTLSSFEQRREM